MKTFILSLIIFSFCFDNVTAQPITQFKEGDRVVFLGNSITDGGHYHSYIWLYYMTRFPNMPITIFNAGIGGDQASDMYKRLDGDVFSKRPTVLITSFGMNDSGYFEYNQPEPEKFAEKKYQESLASYKNIESRYKTLDGVKLILMSSSPYDEAAVIKDNTPFKNKNNTIVRIAKFQSESAKENGWGYIDLNSQMKEINESGQINNPAFTLCGKDRIHPDNDGHMVMAYLFLKAQGLSGKEIAFVDLNAKDQTIIESRNCKVTNVSRKANSITFDYLAEALPYPLDTIARGWGNEKAQAQALKIVPFEDEMDKEIFKVRGLNGKYRLSIDGINIGTWTASDFEKGINLATQTKTPQYQQALAIMHLNEDRWEIERRFREYSWMQFNLFQKLGLLFADNRQSIEAVDKAAPKDGWVAAKRDLYSKAMHSEVRKAWQDEMDVLVKTIYDINQPVKREITLSKVQ